MIAIGKHARASSFLAVRLCFLLALLTGSGALADSRMSPPNAFQKGLVYASWLPGEYASAASDATLAHAIKPLGVNWISIVVTCYQDDISSTRIQCNPELTPTDSDLKHIIQDAHRTGLRVMLKPHLDLPRQSSHWRGEIGTGLDATAWQDWFASYTAFITHYARLAQQTHADYFVVGTELESTTGHVREWRAIIKAVRTLYTGRITYAAHHQSEEFAIVWWDALDAIGIDAYYPLAANDHPTLPQIKAAWKPIVSQLEYLSRKWRRPIILTEIGYESIEGTNRTPWHAKGQRIEFQEQADCYQAVFEAFSGKPWWQGIFWWVWTTRTLQNSARTESFTTYNKPADEVLKTGYQAISLPQPDNENSHP